MSERLEMSFDPNTIEHLGIQMYSSVTNALAELVANAYDAQAKSVRIHLKNNPKEILIIDDGIGMNFEEINDCFLRIGRKKRTVEGNSASNGRLFTGRKGLGKLSLFGLGKNIEIFTKKKNESEGVKFSLKWDDILQTTEGPYTPKFERKKLYRKFTREEFVKGTCIKLSDLKRKTPFILDDILFGLAKLFHFVAEDFKILVKVDDSKYEEVSREQKYKFDNKQFEWDIKDLCLEIDPNSDYKDKLKGKIITTLKPMKVQYRGITLFAHGRQANAQDFFGMSEAGHAFSYMTGWIDADYLDSFDYDIISTDRQSLNWELDEAQKLKEFLHKLLKLVNKKWSQGRSEEKMNNVENKTGVKVKEWYEKVPERIRDKVSNVVTAIEREESVDDESFSSVVKQLYELLPPYTDYHFRNLHPKIQEVSKLNYEKGEFYTSINEGVKKYLDEIDLLLNALSLYKSDMKARPKIGYAFGFKEGQPPRLKLLNKKRSNGLDYEPDFVNDYRDTQRLLSEGMVAGYRNPICHLTNNELKEANILTEQNCLDALSILSLLFYRLDEIS